MPPENFKNVVWMATAKFFENVFTKWKKFRGIQVTFIENWKSSKFRTLSEQPQSLKNYSMYIGNSKFDLFQLAGCAEKMQDIESRVVNRVILPAILSFTLLWMGTRKGKDTQYVSASLSWENKRGKLGRFENSWISGLRPVDIILFDF